MRPRSFTVTGVGVSQTIPVDWRQENFKISVYCTISGTATYTVQACIDNILAGDTPSWIDHPTLTNKTVNADGNYDFPITALRLNVTASTGSVTMRVLQSGEAD